MIKVIKQGIIRSVEDDELKSFFNLGYEILEQPKPKKKRKTKEQTNVV